MKNRVANMIVMPAAFILLCSLTVVAQRPTSLRGQVTDQFGAVVVGATVTVTDSKGKQQTIQTDSNGAYRFDGLGNTVALTDSNGNVVNTYAYDHYVQVTSSTGTGSVAAATAVAWN